MELEKRVQALEQEVEILKNQIQATLLEIQELMLTNRHTELRSGDAPATHGASANPPHAAPPIKSFRPSGEAVTDAAEAPPVTAVRSVSLDNGHGEAHQRRGAAIRNTDTFPQVDPAGWSSLEEMEEWVGAKIEKYGPEHTRQLVHMYGSRGRFTTDVIDALLQFVDLYERTMNPPFVDREAPRAHAPRSLPQDNQRRIPPTPTRPEAPRPTTTPARSAANRAASSAPTQAKPPGVKSAPSKARTEPRKDARPVPAALPEVDEPEGRTTVLRLIAGIYTASAGVKWNKRDG